MTMLKRKCWILGTLIKLFECMRKWYPFQTMTPYKIQFTIKEHVSLHQSIYFHTLYACIMSESIVGIHVF